MVACLNLQAKSPRLVLYPFRSFCHCVARQPDSWHSALHVCVCVFVIHMYELYILHSAEPQLILCCRHCECEIEIRYSSHPVYPITN